MNLKNLKKFIYAIFTSLVYFLFIGIINSEESFSDLFLGSSYKSSLWTPNNKFNIQEGRLSTIVIPFNYPMEAEFLSQNPLYKNYSIFNIYNSNYSHFGLTSSLQTNLVYQNNSTKTQILSYTDLSIPNQMILAQNTNPRFNDPWSQVHQKGNGIVFMYLNKNVGLNFDMTMRLASGVSGGTESSINQSNITFNYKINKTLFEESKLNLILQLSNVQKTDARFFMKRSEITKNQNLYMLSPGFSFTTKSMMFEGLIQVPLVSPNTANLGVDSFGRLNEIQGRLGMKWGLPEYIKP